MQKTQVQFPAPASGSSPINPFVLEHLIPLDLHRHSSAHGAQKLTQVIIKGDKALEVSGVRIYLMDTTYLSESITYWYPTLEFQTLSENSCLNQGTVTAYGLTREEFPVSPDMISLA